MLMPDYFDGKADRMIELYRKLEEFIMRDIARRILSSGKLPATADRLVWKLEQMGEHKSTIMRRLASFTKMTTAEIKSLLQDAVLTSWEDDAKTWEKVGVELSKPLENPRVIETMDAEYKKCVGELNNLTRTTMDTSQQRLINMLNEAEMRVSSGVQSYDAAVCDILDQYGEQGVKVKYPSGREISLEAAVRMCVVTSMNQTAAKVSLAYMDEMGTDLVVVSAHSDARYTDHDEPANHMSWQGQVYRIKPEDRERILGTGE